MGYFQKWCHKQRQIQRVDVLGLTACGVANHHSQLRACPLLVHSAAHSRDYGVTKTVEFHSLDEPSCWLCGKGVRLKYRRPPFKFQLSHTIDVKTGSVVATSVWLSARTGWLSVSIL